MSFRAQFWYNVRRADRGGPRIKSENEEGSPPDAGGETLSAIKTSEFDCLVCGAVGPKRQGNAYLCVEACHDPRGLDVLDGEHVSFRSGGVCEECLRSKTMDEIMSAPRYAKFTENRAAGDPELLETADAKAKLDPDFDEDEFIDAAGLRGFCDQLEEDGER